MLKGELASLRAILRTKTVTVPEPIEVKQSFYNKIQTFQLVANPLDVANESSQSKRVSVPLRLSC